MVRSSQFRNTRRAEFLLAGAVRNDKRNGLGVAARLKPRPFKSDFPLLAHRTREKWGTRKVVRVHA